MEWGIILFSMTIIVDINCVLHWKLYIILKGFKNVKIKRKWVKIRNAMMKFWNYNEGEYINNKFLKYLAKTKICHDINTPLTYPQQNKKVERRYHNHWKYAQRV